MKVGGEKFGEFTEWPILKNIKEANWRTKVWRILSIRRIRQTKVPPNFCRLRYFRNWQVKL